MKTYLCEEEGTQFTVNAADIKDAREAAGLYGGSVIKELQPESDAAHTSGPWIAERATNGYPSKATYYIGPPVRGFEALKPIGNVSNSSVGISLEETRANANLIAAAPELLNALEALKEWGCTYTSPSVAVTIEPENSPHDLLVAAVEAIDKAKGGQQ